MLQALPEQRDAAGVLRAHGIDRVLVVRTCDETNALVRLQTKPLLDFVPEVSSLTASLACAGARIDAGGTCLAVFHYNDREAIAEVRRLARIVDVIPVCFGSDLYSFDHYLGVHDLAELYIMPTEAHRRILAAQVSRPVYHVEEALDPIGLRPGSAAPDLGTPSRSGRRVLWFGYAESFAKSMATLMPAVEAATRERLIDDFVVMVDEHRFPNRLGVKTTNFDGGSFWETAQGFDYCLLSHMPLDLKLNSYLKSPNKAVTALTAGLVPLASATPAYETLFARHGLDRFLFSSASDLVRIFQRLEPEADRETVRHSGIVGHLMQVRSGEAIAQAFLASCTAYIRAGRRAKPLAAPPSLEEVQPEFGFVDHLRRLAPSLSRAAKSRISRLGS